MSARVATLVDKTRGGLEFKADRWRFDIHVSPFPLERKKPNPVAQEVLREAAKLAKIG